MRTVLFIGPVAGLAALLLAGGCSSDKKNSADALHPNPSQFDLAKDPPISAETRFAAGQFAESQGHIDRAVEQYREAVKLDPKQQSSLYRLGVLYTQQRDYTHAIEAWKQYVVATGGTAAAYSDLGFCFELAGKLPEAELAYKYGIKIEPTNRVCRMNYARMLARTGRELEAVQQFSAVLKPSDVHYHLGTVYEQMGRRSDAKAEYEKAIQADPNNNDAQNRLSMIE